MKGSLSAFFLFFGLYLWTMPPSLPPYRDAGEMTAGAFTLGVSHPTSYPLYILLGHAAEALPLGNRAYRLTLLSALAGAAALAVLHGLCRARFGAAAAWGAACLLGLNPTFWSVCLVPEMYSLWILGAVILLGAAWNLGEGYSERSWLGFAALFGLLLGNRLDLLLWAPGLLWIALAREVNRAWAVAAFLVIPALMILLESNSPIVLLIVGTALLLCRGERWTWTLKSLTMACVGLSIYLYLPIRSQTGPWLDWNHPAAFANLMDSILRTKYGGTLDLLSKSYGKGAMFGANMEVYGRHLWRGFSAAGLAAAFWGCAVGARKDFRRWLGAAALYWWSGPLFLFMANLPPNPHALSIVEPHYLLSDLVLVWWAAQGLAFFGAASWTAVAALTLVPFFLGRLGATDRRGHFFSYDFAKNVFKSAPPGAAVVAKKDVQLYTLWHYQTVQGWRPDIHIVSQGLAGAAWYRADWRRREPGFPVGPLRSAEDWRGFSAAAGPVYAAMDADLPLEARELRAEGLLSAVSPQGARRDSLWELFARRGRYDYESQPDFFTSDIIDGYSQALYRAGAERHGAGDASGASSDFLKAWSMHWAFPEPSIFLGYIELNQGRWPQAKKYYELAVSLYNATLALTDQYHSLPELKANVGKLAAQAHLQLGFCEEKMGDRDAAERRYMEALNYYPLAQAHFNIAVLYWNKDWRRVESELSETLRLEPGHSQAAQFLARLRGQKPAKGG